MRDLVNDFRNETLGLPALHTRQATYMMIDEKCTLYLLLVTNTRS